MEPVYTGMPTNDTTFNIHKNQRGTWGEIRCGGPCQDDYDRIVIYHQVPGVRWLKLQKAAMDSLRAAEKAVGHKILCTGTWRSCSEQTALYNSNHTRFAPPNVTAHCRGLAIDVDQNLPKKLLRQIDEALQSRAWHQARPDDEPWHYSFGIKV